MQQKPPPGTIWIDLDEGYRPHFTQTFVARYDPDSIFVLATADCLTERHVQVLMRADKLPATSIPLQLGLAEASAALNQLFAAMSSREVEKPAVLLMQSAMGHADTNAFEQRVDSAFGPGTFTRWLGALEQRNFALAISTLGAH